MWSPARDTWNWKRENCEEERESLTDAELAPMEEGAQPRRPPPYNLPRFRHQNRPHPRQRGARLTLRGPLCLCCRPHRCSTDRLRLFRPRLRHSREGLGQEASVPRLCGGLVHWVGVEYDDAG